VFALLISLVFSVTMFHKKVSKLPEKEILALNNENSIPDINNVPVEQVTVYRNKAIPLSDKGNEKTINNVVLISNVKIANTLDKAVIDLHESDKVADSNKASIRKSPVKFSNSLNKSGFEIEKTNFLVVDDRKDINPHRWSISAMASPTYYSSISSGKNSFSQEISSSENPAISYSGGLGVSYKINKRLSIQSGVYYASLDQVITDINSYSGFENLSFSKGSDNFEVRTSKGIITSNNPDIFLADGGNVEKVRTFYTSNVFDPVKANLESLGSSLSQNLSYLEIPVILRYKIIDKTIGVNIIGGMSYNMLVENSVFATSSDGGKYSIGETSGLNQMAISSSLGMGMQYNFSQKFSLNLEPTFKYYLNPFSRMSDMNTHPYTFGILSGVSYRF